MKHGKLLYWHFQKLTESSQSGLDPVKDRGNPQFITRDGHNFLGIWQIILMLYRLNFQGYKGYLRGGG